MDWVLLLGRVLFGVLFIGSGVMFHLVQREMAVGYARAKGAPLPDLSVPLTGIAIAVAGVLVIVGLWVDLAALILVYLFQQFGDAIGRAIEPALFD